MATRTAGTPIDVGDLPLGIAITPDQAPQAAVTVLRGAAGSPTVFDAAGSTVRFGTIVSYVWDFGDGTTETTTIPFTAHIYDMSGTYTATVTETSSGGTSTSQVFTGQTVSLNGGPQAVATAVVMVPVTPPIVWVPVGGPYVGDPAVITTDGPSPLQQPSDVAFAVSPSGQPVFHERLAGGWSTATPLGGLLASDVAPAQTLGGPGPVDFEVFGIGVDGALWYRTRTAGWQSLGGAFNSEPTAVTFDGDTYVFAVGIDDALWYRTPGTGWATLGGLITSDLGVTTDGNSLYVSGIGGDGALWTRRLTGTTWIGFGRAWVVPSPPPPPAPTTRRPAPATSPPSAVTARSGIRG